MKPELSERLFVENLFSDSISKGKIQESSNIDVEKLTGDASTRRYYRVSNDKESYVVCLANPLEKEEEISPFIEVQKLLKGEKIRVPEVYDCDLLKGYFLEEDLGDQTLLKHLATIDSFNNEEALIYKKVIDILVNIHNIQEEKLIGKKCFELSFDFEKLFDEVSFSNNYFCNNFLGHILSAKENEILDEGFSLICEILAKQKRVLTHRDFHTRNIMVKKKELILIDFQDARMGIPQYDLVSILEDAYYKIQRSDKYELKRYYFNSFFSDFMPEHSFDDFLLHYDYMAMQRIYKAIGSFSYIYSTRGDQRYLKYIGYCFENLRTLMLKYKDLTPLRKTLAEIYYEY